MKRENIYLLGCLYAINQLVERGSVEYAIIIDGEWKTIPWKEIYNWIEKKYKAERENKE